VILVAESWGGVRATLMLRSLLDYGSLADGSNLRDYQDLVVHDAISAHYAAVFPTAPDPVPPETIVEQFGHQVLIQPAVGGDEVVGGAPVSPSCLPSGFESYQCDELAGWSSAQSAIVEAKLVDPALLAIALGTDLEAIALLGPASRGDAFRALHDGGPGPDESALSALLGPLTTRDLYYVPKADIFYGSNLAIGPSGQQGTISSVDEVDLFGADLGAEFLGNARHVLTFITDAELDRFIYAPWIGSGLLAKHPAVLSDAVHDTAPRIGIDRPGWLTLSYQQGGTREIRMPHYASAGHVVSQRAASELLQDVMTWYGTP
jgi:hypothetical protein